MALRSVAVESVKLTDDTIWKPEGKYILHQNVNVYYTTHSMKETHVHFEAFNLTVGFP